MRAAPASEGTAQRRPPDGARSFSSSFFDVADSDWAPFLMLCNFEDGAFEVMHELDSFPASS